MYAGDVPVYAMIRYPSATSSSRLKTAEQSVSVGGSPLRCARCVSVLAHELSRATEWATRCPGA